MSSTRVVILNLGLGNLHSVAQAFARAGADAVVSADVDAVARAERLVFPGQGAFSECAEVLGSGVGEAVVTYIRSGRPYLGICLGMQALFNSSEEAPDAKGLGVFSGSVKRFDTDLSGPRQERLKVPHMGWNQVKAIDCLAEDGAWYYFTHSYHCVPDEPQLQCASVDYGGTICAAVRRDNVFACQFHPEKSHRAGARLIERYLKE